MNNSVAERLGFFCNYYLRKLFSRNNKDDLFRKRFYRATRGLPVTIQSENENELIFALKNKLNINLHICVRKKNSSDIQVFDQVFVQKEYEPLVKIITDAGNGKEIRLIIDAGANVGFTSLYLRQFFSDAYFLVIEPDEKNAAQLRKNFRLNTLDHAEIYQAGLWSSDCWLQINRDADEGKEWSFSVTGSHQPTDIKGISFSALLEKSHYPVIDILKMDIEGGEKELFSKEEMMEAVLRKTRYLALEIHDRVADRNQIISLLEKCNFRWFSHKELTIAKNESVQF